MKKALLLFCLLSVSIWTSAETYSTQGHCKVGGKLIYDCHFDNKPDTIILTGDCGNTLFDPEFPDDAIRWVLNHKNISISYDDYNGNVSFICGFSKNCGLGAFLTVLAYDNTLDIKMFVDDGEPTTCGEDFDMVRFYCPVPDNGILNVHINDFDTVVNLDEIIFQEKYFSSGSTWTEYLLNIENSNYPYIVSKYQYSIGNDTIIDGIRYSRLVGGYDAVIREFGPKVYARIFSMGEPWVNDFLLYDFSLEVGDFYKNPDPALYGMEVLKVDSIQLSNGAKRKRIAFGGTDWIEGVGATNGLLNGVLPQATDYTVFSLVCFKQESGIVYENEETNLDGQGCENLPVEVPLVQEVPRTSVFVHDRTIQIEPNGNGQQPLSVVVYDSMGTVCRYCPTNGLSPLHIDMSDFGTGCYIVEINYPEKTAYSKVII